MQVSSVTLMRRFSSSSRKNQIYKAFREVGRVTAEDLAQLSPYLTSHILRLGAYATDELHIPPDVFDPALDEVDFGGEQPAAA
jgi:hypothetical protein